MEGNPNGTYMTYRSYTTYRSYKVGSFVENLKCLKKTRRLL